MSDGGTRGFENMQTATGQRIFAGERPGLEVSLNLVWIGAFLAIAPLFINDAIGPISPLFLLAFGGLLTLRSVPAALHDVYQYRWMMIYPAYAVLSTVWSNYPGTSLRHSVQLVITFALGIVVARCLTPKGLHRIFFVAFSVVIVISLIAGNHRSDGIAIGIFNSKNSYAAALAISILASTAMALDRTAPLLLRGFGCAMIGGGYLGLVTAESAGTVLTLIPAIGIGVSLLALGKLPQQIRRAVVGFALVVGVILGAVALTFGDQLLALILSTAGKDATLTGRTELWGIAKVFIAERPLLGVGYQAFWVKGFTPAEILWQKFMITSRSGFNFHNMFYESTVQLGLIGVLMIVAMLAWVLTVAFKAGIRQPSAPIVFIVSMLVFIVLRSFGEVGPFLEFRGWTVFIVSVLVFYGGTSKHKTARRPPTLARPAAEYRLTGPAQ